MNSKNTSRVKRYRRSYDKFQREGESNVFRKKTQISKAARAGSTVTTFQRVNGCDRLYAQLAPYKEIHAARSSYACRVRDNSSYVCAARLEQSNKTYLDGLPARIKTLNSDESANVASLYEEGVGPEIPSRCDARVS